jgi:hypothetical protein
MAPDRSSVREWAERRFSNLLGETEEPDVEVDDERAAHPAGIRQPGGRVTPIFKRFTAGVVPPPPSPQYRRDQAYAGRQDWAHDSMTRAMANHRRWQDCHSGASNDMLAWFVQADLLGDEIKAAYQAQQAAGGARQAARDNVAAARTAAALAEEQLAEATVDYLQTDGARLPSGAAVIDARAKLEAAGAVATAVETAIGRAGQRWGAAVGRIDWPAALEQVGSLDGDGAETAAAWLDAKLDPPAGPTEDPLRWL